MKRIRAILAAAARLWALALANGWELLFLGGLTLFAAGLYQVWPPLAWIVTGPILMALGVWGARVSAWVEARRKAAQR